MRIIPSTVEGQLEKLKLSYHERHALYIYAEGGCSPPDWLSDKIARRIGTDKYLRAWALLTGDRILEEFAEINLSVQIENLPTLQLAQLA